MSAAGTRPKLLVSFSGGRTSAYMTKRLLDEADGGRDVVVVFANTGQEDPATLDFVHRCDQEFGFGTVWIEALPDPRRGVGTRFAVVDYDTASRAGQPFERVIAKHGIPNRVFPHCSRELKERPIRAYARSIGWGPHDYNTAIGIRADEFDRVSAAADRLGLVYPLVRWGVTKRDVLDWWAAQPFDLYVPEHFGNCVWCWKKSHRKLLTGAAERPEAFDFPRRMEREYPNAGPGHLDRPRRFFRGRRAADDILSEARRGGFEPFRDGNQAFDPDLDVGEGTCGESCEVFTDDGGRAREDTPPPAGISMCSGIEAATVAAPWVDWLAYSEVEPFPSAVLAHRLPATPNLGDMTAVDWGAYAGLADVVIAGMPCQSFSISGLKRGLADPRGGLTLRFVEAVRAIDPAFTVWENVPHVLGSRDNAFGCLLAGLVGADEPLRPRGGRRWPRAGAVAGPEAVVAWRVLDAQYWGVPQRRRRVFVVRCSRAAGFDPLSVLFERDGVPWDPAPRDATREAAARNAAGGAAGDGRPGGSGPAVLAANAEGSEGLPYLTASNIGKQHNNQAPLVFSVWPERTQGADLRASPVGVASGITADALAESADRGVRVVEQYAPRVASALTASGQGVSRTGSVRRLTPRECERLQGFPDDWTLVPYRGAPAKDSPRYRALGNSMAVPVVRWIFDRIRQQWEGRPV